MAFISLTSMIVSAIQETLITLQRYFHIVLMGKKVWPGKRGVLMLALSVWLVAMGISATIVTKSHKNLPNRFCLALLEEGVGHVLFVLCVVYTTCLALILFCAIKIHRKVLESASEITKMTERKMRNSKRHKKKLVLIVFVFFFCKISTLFLASISNAGVILKGKGAVWIFAPCIGASAAVNPAMYTSIWKK
jgi:hypothetical protein